MPKSAAPLVTARPAPTALPIARPFVKWAGGKRKVYHELRPHLLPFSGRYHEPFVGGGAVFFAIASSAQGLPKGAILSDQNLRLVRTWTAIRDNVDRVISRLDDHQKRHARGGADYYYKVRAKDIDRCRDFTVAAWFIYLNKTGFNGLYRVNSKNIFNVPVGKPKATRILDEPNLRAVHALLQGVQLHHQDFGDACDLAKPGDAVYLDPPYVPLSRSAHFRSYTSGGFGDLEQQRLADVAAQMKLRGVRVVLSNHDTPGLRRLYKSNFKVKRIQVVRSINRDKNKRGPVAEVVLY